MLYELIVRKECEITYKCKRRYIWCKDGSFISPSKFKNSDKEAYGYALDNNKAVRLRKSTNLLRWSLVGTDVYSYSRNDGVTNSNNVRSAKGFGVRMYPSFITYSNAGIESYLPSINELYRLRDSILLGFMNIDLKTAGLYEKCNYREGNNKISSGWDSIWSSTSYSPSSSYFLRYDGHESYDNKGNSKNVIPFFKF